jgi:tetratricopeptide (TPR) repeat protein
MSRITATLILALLLPLCAAAPARAETVKIAVFDFEARQPSQAWLGACLANHAVTLLSDANGFNPAPRDNILLQRRLMGVKPGAALPFEKKDDLSGRIGADAFIEGSFSLTKDTLEFRGTIILRRQGDAQDISFTLKPYSLEKAQSELAAKISGRIGRSLKNGKQWGTSSKPAYENYWRGRQAYETGARTRAKKALNSAVSKDSKFAAPRIVLARMDIDAKRYNPAIQQLERCLKLDSGSHEAHYYIGIAYFKKRKPAAASTHLKAAANGSPNNPLYHWQLGVFYRGTSLYDKALEELNRAVALDPAMAPAWYELAAIYAYVKKRDKTLDNLEKAVSFGGRAYASRVKKDPEFGWLSKDKRFKQILQSAPR